MSDSSQFEEPILKLRREIDELTNSAEPSDPARIDELQKKLTKVSKDIYDNLTPWQKTLVARNPMRPYTLDFIGALFEDFMEMSGDRAFGDDRAIVSGFASFDGHPCAVIGHQKGRDTKEKILRTFGSPHPE